MYKNRLENGLVAHLSGNFEDFNSTFEPTLLKIEQTAKLQGPARPRRYDETEKSVKSVKGSGLIETKDDRKKKEEERKEKQTADDELQANIEKMRNKFVS